MFCISITVIYMLFITNLKTYARSVSYIYIYYVNKRQGIYI